MIYIPEFRSYNLVSKRTLSGELRNGKRGLLVGSLTPSAKVLGVEGETEAAVVGHLLAAVDEDVDVIGIIQWLRSAPDDGKHGRLVGRRRQVSELHVVTVDGVTQKVRFHVRHLRRQRGQQKCIN